MDLHDDETVGDLPAWLEAADASAETDFEIVFYDVRECSACSAAEPA